ncbi:MAG TPA: quinol:cytochrome C oxidoreductase [Ohtaekwangia sp.]|uniref:quinol:cytochrome C oxidoreductase n=1 Tax=Ohtaekwangia sp. TaxID=2066019 RepID=UPI002F923D51
MAHHVEVAEEQYVFRPETRKKLFILLGVGIVVFLIGLVFAMKNGGHQEEHGGGHGHAAVAEASKLVASADQHGAASEGHEHAAAGAEHHEKPYWVRRLFSTLWMNNVFFTGLGIIGLFFVAIQYAAQAGWSVGVKRIPLAMGRWIPIAGILMLVLWFITSHDIFHWTHDYLYKEGPQFDKIINKKAPFFFWPLAGGTFPLFYIARMVIFFSLWYYFFVQIRKNMLAEDLEATNDYWYKNRVVATVFLIFFGVSSSVSAWDWVMSIDTHWFSTMFGWYVFASWWVTGLATITLIVAHLKSAGYLKVVNSNHLHDLGKFCFAFSIFWTYIWFGQFLLIYYANIPEETVYFVERMKTSPYSWIFYLNLIVNFVLPFLLLMTRDAKRQLSTLKLVCPIIIIGHWFDFFNMVTPGVMKNEGGIGFMEIGVALIFAAAYLLVVLSGLAKMPLFGKNDPMLQESLHHHI